MPIDILAHFVYGSGNLSRRLFAITQKRRRPRTVNREPGRAMQVSNTASILPTLISLLPHPAAFSPRYFLIPLIPLLPHPAHPATSLSHYSLTLLLPKISARLHRSYLCSLRIFTPLPQLNHVLSFFPSYKKPPSYPPPSSLHLHLHSFLKSINLQPDLYSSTPITVLHTTMHLTTLLTTLAFCSTTLVTGSPIDSANPGDPNAADTATTDLQNFCGAVYSEPNTRGDMAYIFSKYEWDPSPLPNYEQMKSHNVAKECRCKFESTGFWYKCIRP
ncbi:hypothetical protein BCR34DRAFT_613359 [Clohesyomyces aquaticus]|uniref:Uncharacterized protein n=1 Tax=Clohesyomyces aquaticus TaxID=1231657 RepID=A0A1Y1ZTH1_9PLEO|nr:hypothetical protein BCR34DRAFT_613359 [Clohesyomyces aquaticus]